MCQLDSNCKGEGGLCPWQCCQWLVCQRHLDTENISQKLSTWWSFPELGEEGEGNQFCKQYNHGLCQQARNIKQPQGTPCQIQGHPQSSPKGDRGPALFWSQPRLNSIRPHNYVISDHPYSHVSFSNSILLDFNWTSYAIAYTLRQGDPANCRVIPQVCYIFKIFVQIVIIDNYFDKKLMWHYKLLYMVRPLSWRFYCPNYQQLGREIIIEKHLFS